MSKDLDLYEKLASSRLIIINKLLDVITDLVDFDTTKDVIDYIMYGDEDTKFVSKKLKAIKDWVERQKVVVEDIQNFGFAEVIGGNETYQDWLEEELSIVYNMVEALWERKSKPKIELTSDEIGILKNIDKKYKYIARDNRSDNNGALTVFEKEPEKNNHNEYVSINDEGWKYLYADLYHLFQNITFESGAHLIADLIKENENGL